MKRLRIIHSWDGSRYERKGRRVPLVLLRSYLPRRSKIFKGKIGGEKNGIG